MTGIFQGRSLTVILVVLTLLLAVAAGGCALGANYQDHKYSRYHAAPACSSQAQGKCRRILQATVVNHRRERTCTGARHRRCSSSLVMNVRFPDGGMRRIEMSTSDLSSSEFDPGKQVSVEYFENKPMTVTGEKGTLLQTVDNPENSVTRLRILATVLGVLALLFAGFNAWRFKHHRWV